MFPDGREYSRRFDWKAPEKEKEWSGIVRLWQADVGFVLSQITQLACEKGSMFFGRLNLKKIGMFGHSMGGATTTQALRNDPRVIAGVNMDGPLFGDSHDIGFAKPYMAFVAEGTLKRTVTPATKKELAGKGMTKVDEEYIKRVFREGIKNLCTNIRRDFNTDAYYVSFRNAEHNTFTDAPLIKKMSYPLWFVLCNKIKIGTIDPVSTLMLENELLVSFFDKYVQGKDASLLDLAFDLRVTDA